MITVINLNILNFVGLMDYLTGNKIESISVKIAVMLGARRVQ